MKLAQATIEHIQYLAKLREQEKLLPNDKVELFDSIDAMDMEELSGFYALTFIGLGHNKNEYQLLVLEAKQKGFGVVDELFELSNLGTALQQGVRSIDINSI
jgi:hypothetical protein